MPVYDAANVPDTVGRGTLDPELAAWLPSGPTLGADVPIAAGRRDHMQLGVGPWPSIGAVATLVLPGPHGSITVRRHTPSAPTSSPSGALVYIHGGGFTYGTLDEFEVPMRLIAERAGILTYIVDYQLAPEAKYPTQIEEIEYVVRWLFDNAAAQGIDPAKIGVGGDSAGVNMTCVVALKLRDENGPRLAVQVPLFPEAAFPADTLAASENRSGLYLESNGIFEMVRNLVKNTDDVPAPLPHAPERRIPCRPAAGHPGHQRIRPAARRRSRLRPQARRGRQRPDLHPQSRPHPRVPAVHPLLSRLPPGHPRTSRPHQDQDRLTRRGPGTGRPVNGSGARAPQASRTSGAG
jgi:acetyl esterase